MSPPLPSPAPRREPSDAELQESRAISEEGLTEWAAALPDFDDDALDPSAFVRVRWVPGVGLVEAP